MTMIVRVIAVPAVGASFYEDLVALQTEGIPLPERLTAASVTHGFRAVRELTGFRQLAVEVDAPTLSLPGAPIPIRAPSGHERYLNGERMIMRRVASLPYTPVDDMAGQVRRDGGKPTRCVGWLALRIGGLGNPDYRPTIHLDIHGTPGQVCDHQRGRMLGPCCAWQTAPQPYPLRIECPVLLDSRAARIETMQTLCEYACLRNMTLLGHNRVDQHCGRYARLCSGWRGAYGADQDARPGQHPQHRQSRAGLPGRLRSRLSRRQLRRDQSLDAGLCKRSPGDPTRSHHGQTGYGRRRGHQSGAARDGTNSGRDTWLTLRGLEPGARMARCEEGNIVGQSSI